MNEKKLKIVLLVEDDEPIIRAIERKLSNVEIELIVARDGEEGFTKADQSRPDLLLLDLIMPNMDGLTLLKKIRATSWGKSMPVIVLTNLSNPESELEAKNLGVVDYLIKTDWKIEDLVKKINKLLQI